MNIITSVIPKNAIATNFSRSATIYNDFSYIQKKISEILIDKLNCLNMQPIKILDLGAGTCEISKQLQILYPTSQIYSLDLSLGMMSFAKRKNKFNNLIVADFEHIPFKHNNFDLVISNCAFQWAHDINLLFKEINRILTNTGVLLFSTFGPDTLFELKSCLKNIHNINKNISLNNFIDLHNIGDSMLHAGLKDPVLDLEKIIIQYNKVDDLLTDLKNTDYVDLSHGLLLNQLNIEYTNFIIKNKYPATFEVIYGYSYGKLNFNTKNPCTS